MIRTKQFQILTDIELVYKLMAAETNSTRRSGTSAQEYTGTIRRSDPCV